VAGGGLQARFGAIAPGSVFFGIGLVLTPVKGVGLPLGMGVALPIPLLWLGKGGAKD